MSERKRRVGVRGLPSRVVGALAVAAAGCGGDDEAAARAGRSRASARSLEEIQENAREEGAGQHRPVAAATRQLVEEFTEATGCTVNTKDGGNSATT